MELLVHLVCDPLEFVLQFVCFQHALSKLCLFSFSDCITFFVSGSNKFFLDLISTDCIIAATELLKKFNSFRALRKPEKSRKKAGT